MYKYSTPVVIHAFIIISATIALSSNSLAQLNASLGVENGSATKKNNSVSICKAYTLDSG